MYRSKILSTINNIVFLQVRDLSQDVVWVVQTVDARERPHLPRIAPVEAGHAMLTGDVMLIAGDALSVLNIPIGRRTCFT